MKYTLLLLFCLVFNNSQAQSYARMFDETSRWVVESVGFGFSWAEETVAQRDTVINSKVYYKIKSSGAVTWRNPRYYVREDSMSRKIYAIEADENDSILLNMEYLLYDFNVEAGDTTIVFVDQRFIDTFLVDTVMYEMGPNNNLNPHINYSIAPDSLKFFYLHSLTDPLNGYLIWVEGVGSPTGLFARYIPYPPIYSVVCFSKDNEQVLQQSLFYLDDTCYQRAIAGDGTISIEKETDPFPFQLLQAENKLILKGSFHRFSVIQIIDLQGRVIQRVFGFPRDNACEFDLSLYPIGLYCVQLLGENAFYAKTFLKKY